MKPSHLIFPAIALAMVGGILAQRLSYADAEDAAPYHAKVRAAVESVPHRIGSWQGTDGEVPPSAIALLKPNALLSRRYVNPYSGLTVDLLIVHCRDARDMAGHYPPICYPSSGWTEQGGQEGIIRHNGQALPYMRYRFSRIASARRIEMTVLNVLILPDGRLVRTMDAVRRQASDYRSHFMGAGQIQFVFGGELPEKTYESVVREFLDDIMPVIKTVSSGGEL